MILTKIYEQKLTEPTAGENIRCLFAGAGGKIEMSSDNIGDSDSSGRLCAYKRSESF